MQPDHLLRRYDPRRSLEFDEQFWPVAVAMCVLAALNDSAAHGYAIAQRLDMPRSTVTAHLHRGLDRVRRQLGVDR